MNSNAPTRYDPSPAALRILRQTFRIGQSWRRQPLWPDKQEMAVAVEAGVMFSEPRVLDHDGWVRAARAAVAPVSALEVGEAFLSSLSSRRMDLRSALGSYAVARYLPEHPYTDVGDVDCGICGQIGRATVPEDLNVFSFERLTWGGIRRDKVAYVTFDLEQYARTPRLQPSPADLDTTRQLISYLQQLPPRTTAAQAAPGMKMVKGTRAEREVLLDILGIAGVLQTYEHPGYAEQFIPASARPTPSRRFIFGHYPICWWTAADGVNIHALYQFFPQLA